MSYLVHYGIPRKSGRYPFGSGKRPYQSLGGGSKTDSSKLSNEELADYVKRKNLEKQYDKIANGPNKTEKAKSVVNETSNALSSISNIIKSDQNQKTWERMDVSNMSDQQLRDAINRENLEIQYSKLFNSKAPEVSKGKQIVQKVFDAGIGALKVTGAALTTAAAIKSLLGGSSANNRSQRYSKYDIEQARKDLAKSLAYSAAVYGAIVASPMLINAGKKAITNMNTLKYMGNITNSAVGKYAGLNTVNGGFKLGFKELARNIKIGKIYATKILGQ